MRRNSLIDRLRGHVSNLLGIRDKAASRGEWWEIDLVIAILIASFVSGILALSQL
jgi:hypothetical protein